VIGRRLVRLTERCHRVLTVAAVIGREFGLAPLQRASQVEPEAVLAALEEAETAQVITPLGSPLGRYAFSHALIRETLYEALPAARRIRLHGQVGAALEAVYGADRAAHLAELAHHFVQAAPAGDAARAVDYARRAGKRAMALLAFEEAAGHYRRALEVVEARAAGQIRLRCDVLLALGDALRKAGDPHPALEHFQHAADLARRLVAPDLLARAALGFEDAVLPAGLPRTEGADPSVALLEEALRVLDPAPSPVRARLLAALARALVFTRSRVKGAALSRQAVDLARQTGDPAAVVYALDAHRIAIWGPDNPGERLAVASEIARLAEEIGDKEMALNGRLWRQHALLERGDVAAAAAEIAALARLADESRQPLYRCYVPLLQANQALLRGQFAEVERLAEQALDLGRRAHNQNAAMIHTAQLLLLRREQGRITEVEAALRGFAAQSPWVPTFSAALAVIASEEGRPAEARAMFEDLAVRDFAGIARTYVWLLNLAFLVEVCVALDDTRRAAHLYRLLLPYADQHILGSSAGPSWGLTARYLGLLAGMLRRWEAAVQHFEAALEAHARIGARPWLARTQYDYARVLLVRGRSANRARADDLLSQALAAAQQIGMPRLAGQVVDLMDSYGRVSASEAVRRAHPRAGDEARRVAAYPDNLTERQVEILHLLAEGRSNKEIAAALSLSVRTVEHHVAHIYARIGASGRVEATAYALRHGLASDHPRPD
jgi:DNA-binding CsgD family transcriptional regulator/tetratricopeptide (TPR) repeat protein